MHVRVDRQRLKDGTERGYVSLAHNVWEEAATGNKRAKPVIFARLGIEEDLDVETVRSMRDAFDRYLQKRLAREGRSAEVVEDTAKEAKAKAPQLKVLASKEYGLRVLVEVAWKRLDLHRSLRRIARRNDPSFDFERIVFGMVLNRIVDPQSKRSCNDWVQDEAWFPEADGCEVQHFYRALDLLDLYAADVIAALQRGVESRLGAEELSLRLIDTTSTYFESDLDDVERAELAKEWAEYDGEGRPPTAPEPQVVNEPPLRMRGHSKDRRPDKPQIVIGIVGTTSGRLLSAEVYPGNESDQKITLDLLRTTASVGGGRVVAVMDSGMGGGPNLAEIDALPGKPDRVSGVPIRNSRFAEEMVLAKAGRWRAHPTKPHFTYRVVEVSAEESPSGRAELWIATRNAKAADRAKRKLERHLARIKKVLVANDRYTDHNRALCQLLSHGTLKRYLRVSRNGERVLLDRDRIGREQRLAGVKVIRSTLVDKPPVESLAAYEALLDIESDFRTFKTPLRLRPMHHRAERRIRAHVLMCALALACMQELEHATGQRFDELRKIFGPVRAVQLEQGRMRFWQRSEWSAEARGVLDRLEVAPGPLTWGSERVEPCE